ncbi:uncharacterized protein LOC102673625 [Apis dorsata]|uniref:uncharacterized protein LOC102673625 n=1 Tax=Apis dorsata TaxID=7462 RepID=UPI0003DF70B8|nr:uncharacterized protein LOC102673625 [Apis dorsata]
MSDHRTMEARFQKEDAKEVGCQKVDRWESEKERASSREMEERGSVVNEVLVKNLQFEQDLPKDSVEHVVVVVGGNGGDGGGGGSGGGGGCSDTFGKIIEHVGQQRAMGYHNVLCDNYENVQNARYKESKVYVTKEEMERQRLMELLRKGDYELAKADKKEERWGACIFTDSGELGRGTIREGDDARGEWKVLLERCRVECACRGWKTAR